MKQIYFFCLLFISLFSSAQNIGEIDPDFLPLNLPLNHKFNSEGIIKHLILPDGKIMILTEKDLYKTDGIIEDNTLDISGFTNSSASYPDDYVLKDFCIQSDGKIIIVGIFTKYRGITKNRMVRLNLDGSLDTTFDNFVNIGSPNSIEKCEIQSDDKIIYTTESYVNGQNNFIRLNSNGTRDNTFLPLISYFYGYFKILNDGKILVSRSLNQNDSYTYNRIFKLNSNGSIDSTFNTISFTTFANQTVQIKKILINSSC